MTEAKDKETKTEEKKTLSLGGKGTLSLKGGATAAAGGSGGTQIRQSLSQGRGKTVSVEVRRKRAGGPEGKGTDEESDLQQTGASAEVHQLTSEEREARIRALQLADEEARRRKAEEAARPREAGEPEPEKPTLSREEELRRKELEELQQIEAEEQKQRASREVETRPLPNNNFGPSRTPAAPASFPAGRRAGGALGAEDEEEEESYRSRMKRQHQPAAPKKTNNDDVRRGGRLTVTKVMNEDFDQDRGRSLASVRRAREKARMSMKSSQEQTKQSREVIVPETITVQELSNRMAERAGDLVKALMKMGVMATVTQSIDADTAELLILEFGHKIKRVTDSDIEIGIEGIEDKDADLLPRPPVVTIMGHVDHGKTSLLDALRSTNVVSGEAGGITQHIGAYQVSMPSGKKITFLDTPGHAAFTEMRARGANITDIVVLVVAANDSIMPQTIEAINHAKAAKVPIIVAVNKIDLPDANPMRVKQDLLQHEIIVEELSGETLCVELSAKKKINLDKLEEAILLQAEVLDLKSNPNREAHGTVVEAKLEVGRGHVATVLVQNGTLKVGDIFVVGAEWGRVRAMMNDRGEQVQSAIPGQPVEVLGLQGAPEAGDTLVVVGDEAKARDISEYRQRKKREAANVKMAGDGKSRFDNLLAASRDAKKELAVVIKGDVHGSVEAIIGSLRKIEEENPEVAVRVLHSGVGAITESDVILANASKGLIVGFNVRANAQARELAERNAVNMRYYNIIYNVIDDVKGMLSGLLSPSIREEYLGQAEIRQVFNISKVGKVAGCMVTIGMVKRGSKVRLLRDNVVIHEGMLKTLKRMKDEVKEVREGTECGMAFESYDDIKEGDIIECYDVISEARSIA
ncbi:MAG: translation initiation factor IF-2 [Micavibrio aeruginosavorus]|uniref:Translation initiation factor IF-2 n=1 Tax=Micavibrio aeruginosavorus TaxID=349221 RepID=A0A7T5R101_9BACT|nr:MAG: translation initiation factor IF-2 [Micavibrio aeruginosavorus]